MSKPNLLVVGQPDQHIKGGLETISGLANIQLGSDQEALKTFAPEAEIILYSGLGGKTISFPEVWRHAKKVRWIHSLATGVDKLLIPELIESPIPVTNARGVFKRPLAEFAVLGMLYFYKQVRLLVENQRARKWDDFLVDWLHGKVMGVVGYGEIGRECARFAKALGVNIYATRRKPELSANDPILDRIFPSTDLKEMLSEVDVLLAAAPLTRETRHMISDAEFAVMKPGAIVINVGRGPVIDEAALIRALQEQRLRGAALDVFEQEPLRPDHPFWKMENVLVSPHCTDRTRDPHWLDLTMQGFLENFRRYINGQELLNVIDKKAGY